MGNSLKGARHKHISNTCKMLNLKLVLLGLMLVQCIISLPVDEAQVFQAPAYKYKQTPIVSQDDLDTVASAFGGFGSHAGYGGLGGYGGHGGIGGYGGQGFGR